jgi:AraC-like DNA-binding protein
MINEYYLSKRSLTDYAQLLNITPKHLTKSVKKATGKTPSELITDKLVLEAKVLLKNTSLSVSEIAYQLNFEDPTYFNRFFKKQTSQTPSLFRKMA